MAASQGRNVNSLRACKFSYGNSVNLLPPSSRHDSAAVNRLDKLEGLLVKAIKFADRMNKKINYLTSQLAAENDDGDDDEDSQSSLNEGTTVDFLRGAQN